MKVIATPFSHEEATEQEKELYRGFSKGTPYSKEMSEIASVLRKASAYHTTNKIEEKLEYWLEEECGIKYEYDDVLHFISGLSIVDEQKYLMFQLRFL